MKTQLLNLFFTFLVIASTNLYAQTDADFIPEKDNSIYNENNNSNGAGQLFSGFTNNGNIRRALIKFDISSIPSGATINTATLTVRANKVAPGGGSQTHNIHQVTTDWGEGTSLAGGGQGTGTTAVAPDATWSDSMLGTPWTTSGGDFNAVSASSVSMAGVGNYTFPSSTNLVALVQNWLDNPSTNFGVILIGLESGSRNARRFNSRESVSDKPTLSVNWSGSLSVNDFALNRFSIIPNPSVSSVTINLPNSIKQADINVNDILGKEIYKSTYEANSKIDVSNWKSGVYLIKVSASGNTKTKRFVKI